MFGFRYSFLAPVLIAGAVGGFIGWTVTRVGCAGNTCSPLASLSIGLVSGLVAAAGVGIVVVLAHRSLKEWGEWQEGADDRSEGSEPPDSDTMPGA